MNENSRSESVGQEGAANLNADAKNTLPGGEQPRKQGKALSLPDPEPWPCEVDGQSLANEIQATFAKHVLLPEHADVALTLWVLHTHAIEAADVSPLLVLISPEKRCGKTRTLRLLNWLVRRPLLASNLTEAALFRVVEAAGPTLLVDEADTFLRENDSLRGVLNSGHTRDACYTMRVVGKENEPRLFSTWGAKAIATIKGLPDTLEDRSILVPMRRKKPGEFVPRLSPGLRCHLDELCRQAWTWSRARIADLADADPALPSSLNDRAADNWRPLIAIAAQLGGGWKALAVNAAEVLSGVETDTGDSAGAQLLADLHSQFGEAGRLRLLTEDVLRHLHTMDDRPWGEWKAGKPISASQLARLLRPFGIKPRAERKGGQVLRGYDRPDFEDAFERYLPPEPQQPLRPSKGDCVDNSTTTVHDSSAPAPGDWCPPPESDAVADVAGEVPEGYYLDPDGKLTSYADPDFFREGPNDGVPF